MFLPGKEHDGNPAFYEALIQNYIYKGPVVEWYIRIKVKMERNYRLFNQLIPVQGQITDIGCGYGPLCYMLSLLSEDREILGIDYDEDKIALANTDGYATNISSSGTATHWNIRYRKAMFLS